MDTRFKDYITTIILVIAFGISMLSAAILQSVPATALAVVTAILGIISAYVANNRVQVDGAIEEARKWKWAQYLLTFVIILAPFLKIYEPQILGFFPADLQVLIGAILAFIIQYGTGARVNNVTYADVETPSNDQNDLDDENSA